MRPLRHAIGTTTVMNKIPFADRSPDRDDHCGGPELSELLVTRPTVARQLRISGESGVCEVATLAGAPLIASHTASIAGPLGLRPLWEHELQQFFGSPVADVSLP